MHTYSSMLLHLRRNDGPLYHSLRITVDQKRLRVGNGLSYISSFFELGLLDSPARLRYLYFYAEELAQFMAQSVVDRAGVIGKG